MKVMHESNCDVQEPSGESIVLGFKKPFFEGKLVKRLAHGLGQGLKRKLMGHSHRQCQKEPKVALYISEKVISLRVQLGLLFDL